MGIIGIGAVGVALTERFVAAGVEVFGPRRGRVDEFARAGGVLCSDNATVAARARRLIVLVPSDAALADVMAEIVPGLQPGHIVLGLGTHAVAIKQRAAAVAAGAGAAFVDGEISGTPEMVRRGRASVLLAGEESSAEALRGVLEGAVAAVTFVGAFGNAVRLKLVTNVLVGIHTVAAAEALVLAQRLGLDPALTLAAIAPSAGGSTMLATRGPMMAERSFPPGSMSGFVRYFDLLRAALIEAGAEPGNLFELTESVYREAIAEGHGSRDIAAVFELLEAARRPP